MLKGLLNFFLGDKSSSDIKEIQPVVDAVLEEEKALESLSADQLREKSAELKSRIHAHVESLQKEIDELKAQAGIMSEADLDAKEAVFDKIDSLELKVNEELEVVLNNIMPEAFALVKETAKRFTMEGDVEVTAQQFDRDIAAERDVVRIEGDKADVRCEFDGQSFPNVGLISTQDHRYSNSAVKSGS